MFRVFKHCRYSCLKTGLPVKSTCHTITFTCRNILCQHYRWARLNTGLILKQYAPHAAVCVDNQPTKQTEVTGSQCCWLGDTVLKECTHVRGTTHRFSKEFHSTHLENDIQHHRSKQPQTDSGSITVLVWVVGSYTARSQQWPHIKSAASACSSPLQAACTGRTNAATCKLL